MDRRIFLRDASLAGLAVGGALRPASGLLAQTLSHPGRIDVHHHYMPPFQERMPWPWSAEISLEAMDRNLTTVQPESSMDEVMRKFQESGGKPVLVTDDSGLIGMVTLDNLAEFLEVARRVT